MTEAATKQSESDAAETHSAPPESSVQQSAPREAQAKGFDNGVIVQARQHYVRPDASSRRNGAREALFKVTDKFLAAKDDATCLLVLGGPGQGKTSYVLSYLDWHRDKRRSAVLAVALGHPKAGQFIATLGTAERKECLLLLDGLDEYPSSSQDPKERLNKVLELAQGFKRIVVTARDHLFAELAEADAGDGDAKEESGPAEARVLYLCPPNDKQLGRYLKQRYSFWKIGRRRAVRRLIQNVPAVASTPLLLAHSDELLVAKKVTCLADALQAMIEAWLFREKAVLGREALLRFAKRIALDAYKKACQGRRARVSGSELIALVRELGHEVPEFGTHRPLLSSAEDGSLGFVHTSLLEYLFSAAFLELTTEDRRAWLGNDRPLWTPLVKRIVAERYTLRGTDLSYADLSGEVLAGLDLCEVRLRGARLKRADLQSARLVGADLSDADCEQALLTGAELTRAVLSGANLARADLSEADLSHARLDGADLSHAQLFEVSARGTSLQSANLDAAALTSLAPAELEWEGKTAIEPITGMRFAWVPGGEFKMGHDGDPPESSPAHAVRVSSFWLGETAVTNRQYRVFLEQTDRGAPEFWSDPRFSDPEQPVVGVRFEDAVAFCDWLGQASGLHVGLPTEAEWEYGARGSDGRRYPWGNEPPTAKRACYEEDAMEGRPRRVGSYPEGRGPHGTLDQAGNVWEWCLDTWDPMAYLKRSKELALDPVIEDGQAGVQSVRGGSWFFPPEDLDATARGKNQADKRADDLGFRVALRRTPHGDAQAEVDLLKLSAPPT